MAFIQKLETRNQTVLEYKLDWVKYKDEIFDWVDDVRITKQFDAISIDLEDAANGFNVKFDGYVSIEKIRSRAEIHEYSYIYIHGTYQSCPMTIKIDLSNFFVWLFVETNNMPDIYLFEWSVNLKLAV